MQMLWAPFPLCHRERYNTQRNLFCFGIFCARSQLDNAAIRSRFLRYQSAPFQTVKMPPFTVSPSEYTRLPSQDRRTRTLQRNAPCELQVLNVLGGFACILADRNGNFSYQPQVLPKQRTARRQTLQPWTKCPNHAMIHTYGSKTLYLLRLKPRL